MANYIVPVCSQGAALVLEFTPPGNVRYTCPSGNASWVAISENEPFNESQLTFQNVSLAWSAGFTAMAVGLVVVMAGKALLRALK